MAYRDFRVLVAVGEEAQLASLLAFACALAQTQQGAVTLLCVTQDGERPDWLRVPDRRGNVPIRVVVREGERPSRVILAAAHSLHPSLLLVGWRGSPGQPKYLLGSTLDPVTRYAPCDVAVVRLEDLDQVHRALVPMSSGPNAPLAMELALRLPDAQITALNVVRESLGPAAEAAGRAQLDSVLDAWAGEDRISAKVVRAAGIVDGILEEAASGYDVVFIGATNESYIDRKLFGNVPQAVATDAPVMTVVARRHAGPVKMLFRQVERRILRVQDSLTVAEHAETYRAARESARARPNFFILIGLAAAIATLGLLMNSPAVVIGAMVIAPLMSPIVGVSMGVVDGDGRLLWDATKTTLRGAALAILVGAAISALVPNKHLTAEILGRTQPSLLDLGVALLAGAVGVYAHCERDALSALSGVAIAVALAPPLAAAGIGITMLDGPIAGGALLTFLTNLIAIVAAGSVVFLLFGFRPDPGKPFRIFGRSMIGVIALLVVVSTTLTILTVRSIRSAALTTAVQEALSAEIAQMEGIELNTWTTKSDSGATLHLQVQVQAVREMSQQEVLGLQERITDRLERPVALTLSVVPVTYYGPLPTSVRATSTPRGMVDQE
jgi:uncharacterized hydrophobic protein (TIGR00271 family)